VRALAIGGDNTDIAFPGDVVFQILANAPPPLAQHLRTEQFRSLVEERTRRFVGRDFIFKAIDDHLSGRSDPEFRSGYVVIRGEPGIGKTALAGQLVKQHGYVHHFNIAVQNIRSVRDFLSNLCAQLIVRYKLDHATLPPAATQDSGFLSQLLREAAGKAHDRPIVVIVDALDEAEDTSLAASSNRLFLPAALPAGVFFVVTTREREEYRLLVDHRKDIYIHDRSELNLADVRQYLRNFMDEFRDQMVLRLLAWGVSDKEFIDILAHKSQGNFMYLVHVLRDIRDGCLTSDNVDNINDLPSGLKEYYQRHWRTMRNQDPDRFKDYYEPIVCILAAAREAVSIAQLTTWTKCRWPHLEPVNTRAVLQIWREFLNEERLPEGPPLYRVYHTSFQEFLAQEVGLEDYHDVIALTALAKIPGFLDG
jgi:AAA ATPase domain